MKKYLSLLLLVPMLTACGQADGSVLKGLVIEEQTYSEQTAEQFGIPPEKVWSPLNFDHVIAKWFPYMGYEDYMLGKSAEEFRSAVHELYSGAKAEGVNTLYLHVHPCGDAYYRSEIFPRGVCLDGGYDPLEIMLEEAHSLGLSVHAWINPLRCQTEEQMAVLPDSFTVKKWADDPGCDIAVLVNGRWYLDPAYTETDELLTACVAEIIKGYDVDGIHIDDYFYPTADISFDAREFAESGASDLAQWRMSNCTRMVKTLRDTVKACDSRLQFGISPQGSINGNYSSQYADVRLWCGTPGYCDYIVPQIYFGFNNESCPFAETLSLWEDMTSDEVKLIIGLAAYKLGKPDKWAGTAGESEWVDFPDIIERQISLVEASSAEGYALYE
ncbi:MAG: family 10 glycosylhydrolase [Ruminococcus sp.]|nr:family 10 glycosylhydrolase [Ruminococcus sp.]